MTEQEMRSLAEMTAARVSICTKEILTSTEAAQYMGVALSYLYKLTMRREIPHYKPTGKMVFFRRDELEQWLQNNRIMTQDEAKAAALPNAKRRGL